MSQPGTAAREDGQLQPRPPSRSPLLLGTLMLGIDTRVSNSALSRCPRRATPPQNTTAAVQDVPPQNTPLCCIDYWELRTPQTQQMQGRAFSELP